MPKLIFGKIVSGYNEDISQNQSWLWFFYPFHSHYKVAAVVKMSSPGSLVFTKYPAELWSTDNQAGYYCIHSRLFCFHPPITLQGRMCRPSFGDNRSLWSSCKRRRWWRWVGWGWGENGCFPWEPASAVDTLISSGESHLMEIALNQTFGHILLCKTPGMFSTLCWVSFGGVVLLYNLLITWLKKSLQVWYLCIPILRWH